MASSRWTDPRAAARRDRVERVRRLAAEAPPEWVGVLHEAAEHQETLQRVLDGRPYRGGSAYWQLWERVVESVRGKADPDPASG